MSAGEEQDTAARPGEDWRPLADEIARNARDFLDGVAALARGEGGEETVPLLLLEIAQILLAGAKLGASKDVILPGNWEPDVGADPDLDLLRTGLGATPAEIAGLFRTWNEGDLESFLIEITADVLARIDEATGRPFIDIVLDQAEQKGTGRWTVQSALDLGIPITGIAEATFARALSGHAEQRGPAQATFGSAVGSLPVGDRAAFVEDVRRALYVSKVVAYAQGFDQIQAGSAEYDWGIDRGAMATIWRGGCIIRARFLNRIREAYDQQESLPSLLVDPYFAQAVDQGLDAWRRIVSGAASAGVPAPAFSSSLSYFDGLRRDRLPAALIQGLRDNFGAHTYRRVDRAGTFHVQWAGDKKEHEA